MRQKNLLSANLFLVIISTVFFGSFFVTNSVLASHTTAVCETNTMKNGSFCNWTDSNSWCGGNTLTCQLEPDSATTPPAGVTGGSWNFCNSCSWALTCNGGYSKCAGNNTCIATQTCLAGQTFDACSNTCLGSAATLKLAYDSAGGTYLVNSPAPVLSILSSGKVGLGTTAPNDLFSIGVAGLSSPAGSADTGHNFTSTYLGSDDYALTNYGLVKSLISSATSSSALWGGTVGGDVWNLNSGKVGIGTTAPSQKLEVYSGNISIPYVASKTNGYMLGLGNDLGYIWRNYAATGLDDTMIISQNWYRNDTGTDIIPNPGHGASAIELGLGGVGNISMLTGAINTVPVSRLFINNSGLIGIGTTNPGYKLQVEGAGYFNGTLTGSLYSTTDTTYPLVTRNTTNTSAAGGNVGLKFALSTESEPNKWVSIESFDTSNWGSNGGLSFTTMSNYVKTKSMVILNNGNVGIGTTAPNDTFSIGNAGTAPAGSSGTGHNFTSSYIGTDDYALANYGVVKTLIASVASARSVFVGLSATAYNGNNSGNSGYAYAYARCAADQAGAHVCTPDEILNTIAIGGTMPAEDAWIFAGPPGYTAAANDCEGRSVATTAARGTYWQKADVPSGRLQGRGLLLLCDQTLKLACCR